MYYLLLILALTALTFAAGYLAENYNRSRTRVGFILGANFLGASCLILTGIGAMQDKITPDNALIFWIISGGGTFLFGTTLGAFFCKYWHNNHLSDEMLEKETLQQKLSLIEKQHAGLTASLAQEGLSGETRQALNEGLSFLNDQSETIELRINVLDYIEWEKSALEIYRKYFAEDYLKGKPQFQKIRDILQEYIASGSEIVADWQEIHDGDGTETATAVLGRVNQILNGLTGLKNELVNYEAVLALKDVRQLAGKTVNQLTPGDGGEAFSLMQEFQLKPLKDELMFERLRIESLKDLREIS